MLGRVTIGCANKALAALAKGGTGNNSDFFGVEQTLTKLLGGHSRRANAGEGVERALGFAQNKSHTQKTVRV